MRKGTKRMMAAVCCIGVLALGGVGLAQAQTEGKAESGNYEMQPSSDEQQETASVVETQEETSSPTILAGGGRQENTGGPGAVSEQVSDTIRIWGPVLGVEEGVLRIDNQSGISYAGEIVLNISEEYSRVLDAENGYPVDLSTIREGDFIYAYIGPAMTMSLPPMTTAEMVICQIPADFKAPEYVQVKSMRQKADGNWNLEATDGTVYHVPSDCQTLPYLTRNIVTLNDITKSSSCLVWTDEMGSAQKIVLFPQDSE